MIWITGLAGAGKTEIGKGVYQNLKEKLPNTIFLDGDVFRKVLGNHGYTREDRFDVAKKISNLCAFMEKQGINVVCSTISLFKEIHKMNRENIKKYYEVYIYVDFSELIERDKKKLYSNALAGKTSDVVGIDIPFDEPEDPHLIIDNTKLDKLEEKIQKVLDLL